MHTSMQCIYTIEQDLFNDDVVSICNAAML